MTTARPGAMYLFELIVSPTHRGGLPGAGCRATVMVGGPTAAHAQRRARNLLREHGWRVDGTTLALVAPLSGSTALARRALAEGAAFEITLPDSVSATHEPLQALRASAGELLMAPPEPHLASIGRFGERERAQALIADARRIVDNLRRISGEVDEAKRRAWEAVANCRRTLAAASAPQRQA